ncbi:MAG: sigma factor-like helix-turn-helix DNA-binding protein, partial [Solirubrobacteraceae bacterium]
SYLIANELTTRQRDVLVALAINGVEPKELAAQLDCTPGALYKTLHDARRKLKRHLRDGVADGHQRDRVASSRATTIRPNRKARPTSV